ncbi:MAG: hypothetical protein Greene101415_798 [Parcubacteria group bacterium Greene1014_15]|nr:MAG: hypothetical protein Greene101415_798 [Parcubacteria group bacterium Greene1014_15]
MTLAQHSDTILIAIYCFVDDFLKGVVATITYALKRPGHTTDIRDIRGQDIRHIRGIYGYTGTVTDLIYGVYGDIYGVIYGDSHRILMI